MTLIVAARFNTFDAANAAAQRLMEAGVHEDALNVFYVNPPGAHDAFPVGGDQAADPDARRAPGGCSRPTLRSPCRSRSTSPQGGSVRTPSTLTWTDTGTTLT